VTLPRPHTEAVVLHTLPDGTHALTDATRGTMLVVNDVGAAVWLLLEGAASVAEVVDEVTATLGAERAAVARDVSAFLEALVQHGFAG
jgi:hypothetical protein